MIKGPKTASDWGEVILQIKNEVLLTKRRVHAGLVNTTSVSYTEVLSTFFFKTWTEAPFSQQDTKGVWSLQVPGVIL